METYPIDIDPEQIVRWLMAESRATPFEFKTLARRSVEVRELPARKELRLGEEERDDLTEVAAIGTLQIAPAHAEGWLLTVVVEDEFGPRIFSSGQSEGEQEIDLAAFYDSFIRPHRGVASAVAEVEGPDARARLSRLLENIETNRHAQRRND